MSLTKYAFCKDSFAKIRAQRSVRKDACCKEPPFSPHTLRSAWAGYNGVVAATRSIATGQLRLKRKPFRPIKHA